MDTPEKVPSPLPPAQSPGTRALRRAAVHGGSTGRTRKSSQVSPSILKRLAPEEVFDVVNAQDQVVERKPRSEVHRLGLLHRAVHVLVFNSRGEVFLQKRSMLKDRQPGVWDSSASGHVDAGEEYDRSAVRELQEELGLVLAEAPRRLFKVAACPETDREFVWVYRCESEGPFTLNPQEIDAGGWFVPDEVTRSLATRPNEFATAFNLIWKRLTA
jgi:isopentenyldiphosphate isomerase